MCSSNEAFFGHATDCLTAGDGNAHKRQEEERQRREAEETDAEWGGKPQPASSAKGWGNEGNVPRTEKYDLEPYDDDDYEPSQPSKASNQKQGSQVLTIYLSASQTNAASPVST